MTRAAEAAGGRNRPVRWAVAATVVGLGSVVASSAGAAAAPEPTYGLATVDGATADWMAGDAWGTMASNDPPMRSVASVSLRYDCDAEVLYVLVQASPGEVFQTIDPAEAYVRLGPSGKVVDGTSGADGSAPDFAWLDPVGTSASGFEASAVVAPGAYPASLRIHGKLPDDSEDGYETIDLSPRYADLTLTCAEPQITTTAPVDPPTSILPQVIVTDPGDPADPADPVEPAVVADAAEPAVVAAASGELPRTGSRPGPLAAVGVTLVAGGAWLTRRARRGLV